MTNKEVALGFLYGRLPFDDALAGYSENVEDSDSSPRLVLEDLCLDALKDGPCVVQFSGGRDSSAVLAVATYVARREGLPLPIPLTKRFSGVNDADETYWQELAIRHLALLDWETVEYGAQADLLSSGAKDSLIKRGPLWSPLSHTNEEFLKRANGCSLLDGEGGDEVFGPRRAAPLRYFQASRSKSIKAFGRALQALSPRLVRCQLERRSLTQEAAFEWLQPEFRAESLAALAKDASLEPLDWRRSLMWHLTSRAVQLGSRTLRFLAAANGASLRSPLLDPRFVQALATDGGRLGYSGRTVAMRRLAGDLLPDDMLSRSTKATFTAAAFGPQAREFVGRWNGEGLDGTLVDVDQLKMEWKKEVPHAMTGSLLQSAWLAEHKSFKR